MPDYRFYFIGSGDRISRRADVICLDDADAMSQAAALRAVYGVEVWEGPRKVGGVAAPIASTD